MRAPRAAVREMLCTCISMRKYQWLCGSVGLLYCVECSHYKGGQQTGLSSSQTERASAEAVPGQPRPASPQLPAGTVEAD